jgi:hypothetical protein
MVSDVLLLSYLDKIGLSLTDEAQALVYLYSEARLYKGASLTLLSQSSTTRSTGNISVGEKKVGHSNTRGTVSSLFFPAQIPAALSLHFQHLMKTKGLSFKKPTVKKKLSSVLFISTANEHILTESWLQIVEVAIRGCRVVSPGHGTDYVHYFII